MKVIFFLLGMVTVTICIHAQEQQKATPTHDACQRIIPTQEPFFVDSESPVTPTRAQLQELFGCQVGRLAQIYAAYQQGVNNAADVAHAADAIRKTAEDLGAEKKQTTSWSLVALCCAGAFSVGVALGHFYL